MYRQSQHRAPEQWKLPCEGYTYSTEKKLFSTGLHGQAGLKLSVEKKYGRRICRIYKMNEVVRIQPMVKSYPRLQICITERESVSSTMTGNRGVGQEKDLNCFDQIKMNRWQDMLEEYKSMCKTQNWIDEQNSGATRFISYAT